MYCVIPSFDNVNEKVSFYDKRPEFVEDFIYCMKVDVLFLKVSSKEAKKVRWNGKNEKTCNPEFVFNF